MWFGDWEFDWDEIRRVKLTRRKGDHVTAEIIADQLGVSEKTVRRAEKFADAVETLQQVSPQAAERVLRGEVRDALTALPKAPEEVLANSQHRPTTWTVGFAFFVVAPNNWRCSRSQTLTHSNSQRALQALYDDCCLNLPSLSRLQFADLPQCLHKRRTKATNFCMMLQSRFENQQVPLVNFNRPQFRVHLSRLQRPVSDGFPNCFATATQLLCQLTNGQHRKSPRLDLLANLQVKLSSQRSRDTFCCFANRLRLLALLHLNAQIALLCCDSVSFVLALVPKASRASEPIALKLPNDFLFRSTGKLPPVRFGRALAASKVC